MNEFLKGVKVGHARKRVIRTALGVVYNERDNGYETYAEVAAYDTANNILDDALNEYVEAVNEQS